MQHRPDDARPSSEQNDYSLRPLKAKKTSWQKSLKPISLVLLGAGTAFFGDYLVSQNIVPQGQAVSPLRAVPSVIPAAQAMQLGTVRNQDQA